MNDKNKKQGWMFDFSGKIRVTDLFGRDFADDFFRAPNCVYSSRKIASERRNEWIPMGLKRLREYRKEAEDNLKNIKKDIRDLLKIQKKLARHKGSES